MSQAGNGSVRPKEDGGHYPYDLKHDEKNMSTDSSWTALPDLILTLLPTGILLASGSSIGKG